MRSITEQGHIFEEWLTPEQLAADVKQVGNLISRDYADKEPLFVVVLNGAFMFAADLIRQVSDLHCEITFIRVSSYWGMATTGKLEFIVPLQQSVVDRDVIIVEDIVDTGLTIHQLKAYLRAQGASSVRTATMLFKPEKLEYNDAKPDYVGHEITSEFVVGYGLDFDGFVRNLDAIYKVKE
jgi:hypoxanthine phosphoribosyltransferase